MKIGSTMDLHHLAELMGDCATTEDAQDMRDFLVEHHDGEDTDDIPDNEWERFLKLAAGETSMRYAEADKARREDVWALGPLDY